MDIAEFISRRLRTDADEMMRDYLGMPVKDEPPSTDDWPDEIDS